MPKTTKPADSRLSVHPDVGIMTMLDQPAWPYPTSRHRRLRMALRLGLAELAKKSPSEFKALILHEVASHLEDKA